MVKNHLCATWISDGTYLIGRQSGAIYIDKGQLHYLLLVLHIINQLVVLVHLVISSLLILNIINNKSNISIYFGYFFIITIKNNF